MNSATKTGEPGLGKEAKLGVLLLVLCALAALFWPRGDKTFREPGGYPLDADGRPAKLGSQLAPVSLVHFWATWCPPCIDEIPSLQRLALDYSEQDDFAVVMIAVDDSKDKVTTFLGPGWDMVLFDPGWDVAKRYGTDKLPETYLVVRGEVVEKFVGATDWNDPAVREKLAFYLGGPVPEKTAEMGAGSVARGRRLP